MPPQIYLPLETFATQVTAKGLEASVLPTMGDEVGALAESFAAHLALVRLLTYRREEDGHQTIQHGYQASLKNPGGVHCGFQTSDGGHSAYMTTFWLKVFILMDPVAAKCWSSQSF